MKIFKLFQALFMMEILLIPTMSHSINLNPVIFVKNALALYLAPKIFAAMLWTIEKDSQSNLPFEELIKKKRKESYLGLFTGLSLSCISIGLYKFTKNHFYAHPDKLTKIIGSTAGFGATLATLIAADFIFGTSLLVWLGTSTPKRKKA